MAVEIWKIAIEKLGLALGLYSPLDYRKACMQRARRAET